MKKLLLIILLGGIQTGVISQSKMNVLNDDSIKPYLNNNKSGAVKFINNCDYTCNAILPDAQANKNNGNINFKIDYKEKVEGSASFGYVYKVQKSKAVIVKQIWYDFSRSDLSFHPLGISLWIKGGYNNQDRLTISLLQQNEKFSLSKTQLKHVSYVNDTILRNSKWTRLFIPYTEFKTAGEQLRLNLVTGIEIGITGVSAKATGHTFYIDDIKQITSYNPEVTNAARFSSIFIQLHASRHNDYNWRKDFAAYKEVGIDTIIIQFATVHRDNQVFNYKGSKAPWGVKKEYSMIDNIFKEAEIVGLKVILGLNGGDYPLNKGDSKAYDTLYKKHRVVINELYNKFSKSPAMAGWYINEEFHDGAWQGWWKEADRMLLANYLQRVAAYAKSKPEKFIVCVAPALWRGRTAAMVADFYKSILLIAKDIDIMYLQDCGGRRFAEPEDFDVYLPQYFEQIKKACESTGVKFGVDVESFKNGSCEKTNFYAKKWPELKMQLEMAGLFTTAITQFSWATFRPGVGAFDEYTEYVKNSRLATKTAN